MTRLLSALLAAVVLAVTALAVTAEPRPADRRAGRPAEFGPTAFDRLAPVHADPGASAFVVVQASGIHCTQGPDTFPRGMDRFRRPVLQSNTLSMSAVARLPHDRGYDPAGG